MHKKGSTTKVEIFTLLQKDAFHYRQNVTRDLYNHPRAINRESAMESRVKRAPAGRPKPSGPADCGCTFWKSEQIAGHVTSNKLAP